jgi:hypothetical protein
VALLALGLAQAQSFVQAVRAEAVPALDGKLDDACWAKAPPAGKFLINNTDRPAQFATSVRVVFDDSTLYLGARCAEPNVASIKTESLPRDNGDVWRTDCIEVMLDPARTQNDYFHIAINASGSIADRACTQGGFVGDMTWDSNAAGASFIGADFWSCELAIPFAALAITPQVGDTWRINVCREKKQPAELSSLAEQGAFNIASRFIELRGVTADLSRYRYVIGPPTPVRAIKEGQLELTLQVPLRNLTGQTTPVLLDAWLIGPSGRVTAIGATIEPPVDQQQTFSLGPLLLAEQGDHETYVRVADPATKAPLAFLKAPLDIRYVPLTIHLLEPWYRNCIFATQNLKDVKLEVEVALDEATRQGCSMLVAIRVDGNAPPGERPAADPSGKPYVFKRVEPVGEKTPLSFAVTSLPDGRLEITATLRDAAGKVVADTSIPLRKLPHQPGEVWLGRDLQWTIEGKPFFMNGAWNYMEDFLPEYNTFSGDQPGALLLDTGIMNDLHYKAKSLRESKLSAEDAQQIREWVTAKRDNPRLFGYYTSDEPEVSSLSAKALEEVYRIVADEDPYHPVIISNDSMEGLRVYARCADINGLHPYPVILRDKPINDLGSVASFVSGAVAFFADAPHKQTVAYLHQGFNYGDYGAVNNRIPNYQEYRDQNLLALICGARGTIQFNRMVAHYPELHIGMPYLTRELKFLEPIMTGSVPEAKLTADSDKVKLLAREYQGQLYVFACNADMTPRQVKLTMPSLPAGSGRTLQVVSEGRTVSPQDKTWSDDFGPYEAHIYTTAPAPKLATVKQIVDEIAQANAARRKPGNLAYQEFEGDGVVVTASSSKAAKFRRPDTGLWHVVDGIFDREDRYKTLTWQDDTDGQFPDWLEIKLPQAHKIGRVVVYPFQESLQDYALEVFDNGAWREVSKVTGQKGEPTTHTFAPVTTDRVRLVVTAAKGKNSMVTEVEVYEQ